MVCVKNENRLLFSTPSLFDIPGVDGVSMPATYTAFVQVHNHPEKEQRLNPDSSISCVAEVSQGSCKGDLALLRAVCTLCCPLL